MLSPQYPQQVKNVAFGFLMVGNPWYNMFNIYSTLFTNVKLLLKRH